MIDFKKIEKHSDDTENIKELIKQQNKIFYKMIFQFIICLFFTPILIILLILHSFEKDFLFFENYSKFEKIKKKINQEREKVKEIDATKIKEENLEKLPENDALGVVKTSQTETTEASNPNLTISEPEDYKDPEGSGTLPVLETSSFTISPDLSNDFSSEKPMLDSSSKISSPEKLTLDSFSANESLPVELASDKMSSEKTVSFDEAIDKAIEYVEKLKRGGKELSVVSTEIIKVLRYFKSLGKLGEKFYNQLIETSHELEKNLGRLVKNAFPDSSKDFRKELVKKMYEKSIEDFRNLTKIIKDELDICADTCSKRLKELEAKLKEIQINMEKAKNGDHSALEFLAKKHVDANLPHIDEEKISDLVIHAKDAITQKQENEVELYRQSTPITPPNAMPPKAKAPAPKKATVPGK
ncbi:MAG: hypothetical protein LBJ09_02010 [Clostridiales bacterium]|jgi:hypothetical protein|nr:hypothetical protein [Clostridiales bacterium]